MQTYDPIELEDLSRRLHLDIGFLLACLESSDVTISADARPLELDHAMLHRLRRLQRLCETFQIDPLIAALLLDRTEQINQLVQENRRLRRAKPL